LEKIIKRVNGYNLFYINVHKLINEVGSKKTKIKVDFFPPMVKVFLIN